MKPSKRHQPKPEAGPAGGPAGGSEAGIPDPGRDGALSALAARAITLAHSKDEADHAQLTQMLLDKAWLDQLDPPESAAGIDPRFLQLTRVLKATARYTTATLEAPAGHPLYLKSDYRRAALIEASATATSPGAKLIVLWRSQLHPEADELESTIQALVNGQSQAALQLLAEAFSSKTFDIEWVISWFRDPVLRHRQDAELLACLEQLLEGDRLEAKRRFALVEALFEYRPTDWYIDTGPPPTPPKRADLTDAARVRLRSIADIAIRKGLIDSKRRAQIKAELAPPAPLVSKP